MKTLVVATLSLLITSSATAQSRPSGSETIEVRRVLVDATVTDRSGNPIIGLAPADFVVTENGAPVEIESADYFTSRRLVQGDLANSGVNVDEVREERYFVLFFHKYPGVPGSLTELVRARADVHRWLEKNLLPNDKVAVIGYDTRMRIFSDFTSDPRILKNALSDVVTFARGVEKRPPYAGDQSMFDHLDFGEVRNETGRIYDAFRLVAEAVEPIPARKIMVVFSQGFSEGSLGSDNAFMQPAIDALNRANVQTWTVEIPGLSDASFQQNLARIALDTGGEFFRNQVNYATTLANADKANAGYYLLSYRSPDPPAEGERRSIEVKLRNPEFTVTARPGYGG